MNTHQLLWCLLALYPSIEGVTQIVTTTSDIPVSGQLTLREAINAVNASQDATNFITFAIPGTEVQIITPLNTLPQIVKKVTIDGYTQPGSVKNSSTDRSSNAHPTVVIQGDLINQVTGEINPAPQTTFGLRFGVAVSPDGTVLSTSEGSTISGLVINNCFSAGIEILGASSLTIKGNFLGTDDTGEIVIPNGSAIRIAPASESLPANTCCIGGGDSADKNLIAGTLYPFRNGGVFLQGSNKTIIRNNIIGTNKEGTEALGSTDFGIFISGDSSTTRIDHNLISGCSYAGINIRNSSGTLITDNFIGTNVSGTSSLANGTGIIYTGGNVYSDDDTIIGGYNPAERNIISGNAGHGILLASFGKFMYSYNDRVYQTYIYNNFIGVDVTGLAALPNAASGVYLGPSAYTELEKNIISGNGEHGVTIAEDSYGTTLGGNFIGTDSSGSGAIPNSGDGIWIGKAQGAASDTYISDLSDRGGNIISGNRGNGVSIRSFSDYITIQNNLIGRAKDTTELGNGGAGIFIQCSSDNQIGNDYYVDDKIEGNTISANGGPGVIILDPTNNDASVRNTILSNSIYCNGGKGIQLGASSCKNLSGPNKCLHHPIITSVTTDGTSTLIKGELRNMEDGYHNYYKVQLFDTSATCISTANGETFVKELSVDADGKKHVLFEERIDRVLQSVSATATGSSGNTSELSPNVNAVIVDTL